MKLQPLARSSVLHCITGSLAKSHRYSAMPLVSFKSGHGSIKIGSSLDTEVTSSEVTRLDTGGNRWDTSGNSYGGSELLMRCIEALVMFISSSIVVVVRCVSCPASTGLGHMCTDLGQQAEPGVSDLGYRGQPEEAVSHWESLSRFMVHGQDWHSRFGQDWHSRFIQDWHSRFGQVWHSGSTQSSYLAQEDVAGRSIGN